MSLKQSISCSCTKCGKSYTRPIELTVHAKDSHETYCACPHCFSKVSLEDRRAERTETSSDESKKGQSEAHLSTPVKDLKRKTKGIEKTKPAGCAHFLGYLKTRPKGSPFPEECLLCAAITKCM